MNKIRVDVKYELGHTITTYYERSDWFCPNCGKQNVWEEQGPGDYYVGVNHVCIECKTYFLMPSIDSDPDYTEKQVIETIRANC
jgi:hypothetical protein